MLAQCHNSSAVTTRTVQYCFKVFPFGFATISLRLQLLNNSSHFTASPLQHRLAALMFLQHRDILLREHYRHIITNFYIGSAKQLYKHGSTRLALKSCSIFVQRGRYKSAVCSFSWCLSLSNQTFRDLTYPNLA